MKVYGLKVPGPFQHLFWYYISHQIYLFRKFDFAFCPIIILSDIPMIILSDIPIILF